MFWKNLLRRKSIDVLMAEMASEHQLRRVLGPISLTAPGRRGHHRRRYLRDDGASRRGRRRTRDRRFVRLRGPRLRLGGALLRRIRRHGSHRRHAYTYAYATLGELFAWIIGWDLMLEYAMCCARSPPRGRTTSMSCCLFASAPHPDLLDFGSVYDRDAWFNLPGA